MRWIFIIALATLRIHDDCLRAQPNSGIIMVNASERYKAVSLIEKIVFGSNYRREWQTPVRVPVFDLKKTKFHIVEMGGGQQTTSLELADEQGREWALRSVEKNVGPPKRFKENTFIQSIIQDHVSGSYPYAGLSVPDLANAAGVRAGEQRLFFVPDDTAFGRYRSAMANKLFILVNNQPQLQKGIATDEMLSKLKLDKLYYVDQKEYLKARLVDWLLADWDRHDDQWRWIQRATDSGVAFQVVSRDRDQAFYRSNGLLVRIVGLLSMPHLDRFNKNASDLKGLSKKTREFDKQFTSQLTKEEWQTIVKEFQKNITDSVIVTALKKQPPEIFAIRGNALIGKLKSRRDGLLKHSMKYYYFLRRAS